MKILPPEKFVVYVEKVGELFEAYARVPEVFGEKAETIEEALRNFAEAWELREEFDTLKNL